MTMRFRWIVLPMMMLSLVQAVEVRAAEGLKVLSFPIGLLVGEIEVRIDMGPSGAPAEVLLDGRRACEVDGAHPTCTVDLGPDPHVHLIEAIRRGVDGRVADRSARWVNRPGQEAELSLRTRMADDGRLCGARLAWAHPLKLDPKSLELEVGEQQYTLEPSRPGLAFDCPSPDEPAYVVASAVFPDGQRAEAATVIGGFGGDTATRLVSASVVIEGQEAPQCELGQGPWPTEATRVEQGGTEVVIVLDPGVGYHTLTSSVPARDVHLRMKTERTLFDVDRLWFVRPDEDLSRLDGFAAGRPRWVDLMIQQGGLKMNERPRIADAVAASGLVAAAGPKRRAVVLLLGDRAPRRDRSLLTPAQARAYLAEVGVPLLVLRNGRLEEDGWPAGQTIRTMKSLAGALELVERELDRQCVAWFEGDEPAPILAARLVPPITLAGRSGPLEPAPTEALLARADLDTPPEEQGLATASGRFEVTAVTVLLSAVDAQGRPVADLALDDLGLSEDGAPVELLRLEPVVDPSASAGETGEPGGAVEDGPAEQPETAPADPDHAVPTVIWIAPALSDRLVRSSVLHALADRAAHLVRLGPVEVVVAGDPVERVLGPTTEAEALASGLDDLARTLQGRHLVEQRREQFLRDAERMPTIRPATGGRPGSAAGGDGGRALVRSLARIAVQDEERITAEALERLRRWALADPRRDPRLMILAGMAFDPDPTKFYGRGSVQIEDVDRERDLRDRQIRLGTVEALEKASAQLAEIGWRLVSFSGSGSASATAAEISGGQRWRMAMATDMSQQSATGPEALLVDPLGSQHLLVEPSRGEVATGADGIDAVLDRTAGWYRLTYQVPRPADGARHALEVEPRRPGVELQLPRLLVSGTSEDQAAVRLLELLDGRADSGSDAGLDVQVAATGPDEVGGDRLQADLQVSVDLAPVVGVHRAASGGQMRVSVVIRTTAGTGAIEHRVVGLEPPADWSEGQPAVWTYTLPLQWGRGAARVGVLVEDLATGVRGSAVLELDRSGG